tara:strand:+ start:8579 stop:8977 length:399 start_codon:yes stop_codon:yes gene_type:complete
MSDNEMDYDALVEGLLNMGLNKCNEAAEAIDGLLDTRDQLRARVAELKAEREWQPIDKAPSGVLCVVGWLDLDETETPDQTEFDWLEEGEWFLYTQEYEHAHAVAPPGSRMPTEKPPYTHYMVVPPLPKADK